MKKKIIKKKKNSQKIFLNKHLKVKNHFVVILSVVFLIALLSLLLLINTEKKSSYQEVKIDPPKKVSTSNASITVTPTVTLVPTTILYSYPTNIPSPTSSNTFPTTYIPAPHPLGTVFIDSIYPSANRYDQSVKIRGGGFGTTPKEVRLKYVDKPEITPFSYKYRQGIIGWNETEIDIWVPSPRGTVEIEVEGANGLLSNKARFEVTAGAPEIKETSSQIYEKGKTITIKGEEFGPDRGSVNFIPLYKGDQTAPYGICSIISWSDNEISCIIPSNLKTGEDYGISVVTKDERHSSSVSHTVVD